MLISITELDVLLNEEVDKIISGYSKKLNTNLNLVGFELDEYLSDIFKSIKIQSKLLVEDICNYRTQWVLNDLFPNNILIQNKFFDEDIEKKIAKKFDSPIFLSRISKIDFNNIKRTFSTLVTMAGTLSLGGIIRYVLQNKIDIPIWAILVGSLIAGGVTFFAVVPAINKSRQEKAIDEFFVELKAAWLDWLKEVEAYYLQEVENFKANLNLQEV